MANEMVSPTDSTAGAARGVCADNGWKDEEGVTESRHPGSAWS